MLQDNSEYSFFISLLSSSIFLSLSVSQLFFSLSHLFFSSRWKLLLEEAKAFYSTQSFSLASPRSFPPKTHPLLSTSKYFSVFPTAGEKNISKVDSSYLHRTILSPEFVAAETVRRDKINKENLERWRQKMQAQKQKKLAGGKGRF